MRKLISMFAVLMLTLSLFSACKPNQTASGVPGESAAASGSATAAQGKADQLGRFKTVDLSGKAFDYTLFYGNKLTMVNVWATWCGYCVQEMPDLAKLSKEYSGKGLAVVGILGDSVKSYDNPVRDDGAVSAGLKIMQQSGVQYTVLQPDSVLCKTLAGLEGYPTTFFIDGNGKVVDKVVGANSYDGWKSTIDQLLEKVG